MVVDGRRREIPRAEWKTQVVMSTKKKHTTKRRPKSRQRHAKRSRRRAKPGVFTRIGRWFRRAFK